MDRVLLPSRRRLLIQAALALGASALPRSPAAANPGKPLRLSQGGPGSAGSVWRPLIERGERTAGPDLADLNLEWVGGDPGQEAVQLLAGALDVSVYGPIGAAESANRGSDVVLFAPGLNNHGSWIVRGDSPYRTPRDLIGKRIATQPETTETFRQARLAAALVGIDLKRDIEIIFGPPTSNFALFGRGDVDGVITIEPTASRLIAGGAREIARVRDMWRDATGDTRPLFLGGQATRRAWLTADPRRAAKVARLYASINAEIHERPQILAELHQYMGIPATERGAIDLLPTRLADTYAYEWGPGVFAVIDRVLDIAVSNKVLAKLPSVPVYETARES